MSDEEKQELLNEDSEMTFEEGFGKFAKWLGKKSPIICAILVSIFFVFYGTVKILPTELNFKEQTIMAVITIISGWLITSLIGEGGFDSAKETKEFRSVRNEYNDNCRKALPFRKAVDQLAKQRAVENRKSYRIRYCEAVGLCYWEIFDDEGYLKTDFDITRFKKDKNYRKKKRYFKKAVNLHIQNTNVFSRADSSTFGIRKEVTESSYRISSGTLKIVIKALFSIASVGIMFEYIGWSVGGFFYAFMQVSLWCAMGVRERLKNFSFIMNKIRPQIIDRSMIIGEFLTMTPDQQQKYIEMAEQEEQQYKIKRISYIEK